MQRIVIVGGGYAGTLAAVRLARAGLDARITLVDAKDHFVERVRLHQVATGQEVRTRPYAELLGPDVDFVRGRAIGLEPDRVVLEDGSMHTIGSCSRSAASRATAGSRACASTRSRSPIRAAPRG